MTADTSAAWLALAQSNASEAREVQAWLPKDGSITAAQVLAAARWAGLRSSVAAQLIGGPARLTELAAEVDVAERSGDLQALSAAIRAYESASDKLVKASYAQPRPSTLMPQNVVPTIQSSRDLQPGQRTLESQPSFNTGASGPNTLAGGFETGAVVPPNIDDLMPPGALSTVINDLPAQGQQLAAEMSQQTGTPFLQRLDDGRVAAVRYVGATWQPIASFAADVRDTTLSSAHSVWDDLPQPTRDVIRTSGAVLGTVIDPVGATFNAGVVGLQRLLNSPAGQPVTRLLEARAAQLSNMWTQLAQHPQGKHLVGMWDNTFGHPQFGTVFRGLTTGAGRTMQTLTNGGLGLLATGVINGQTKIGTFTAGDPKQMPPELAQLYRQISVVPRGMTINYATVPIPGAPHGRVTTWSAGGLYSFLRPSLPWAPEPGTTQLSNAINRSRSGKTELNTWASVVANGPTAYSGIAVNLTDNIGVQRSAYASLGSSLTQAALLRTGPVDIDPLIAGRQTPWLDPKFVSSLGAVRVGITDEVRFPVRVGDKTVGLNVQINRLRTPVRATMAGTLINKAPNGTFGLRPNGQLDPTRPSAVRSQTVFGTSAGFNPQADDIQQLKQIAGLEP